MATLVINNKDVFRPVVNDSIDKDDIFYNQYKRACEILVDILNIQDREKNNSLKNEYMNNIIAFCGERGDGKTSAMLTFAYSVYNQSVSNKKDPIISIEKVSDEIKGRFFAEPIVIDPTMFDESHNIMDVVLAKLYKNFSDKCEEGMQDYRDKDNFYVRQNITNCFAKVYRCVSLIANPSKIKEHEFDYDGNMGKLSKLGESTMLKDYFKELIDEYLNFVGSKGDLIIAIDDLDLCNENAYKLAEQIRKYLILPNVVIIMAVKMDQLQLGIMEHNIANFDRLSKFKDDSLDIYNRVHTMSEKYIAKLIPQNHRIHMPKLTRNNTVIVKYGDKTDNNTLVKQTLDMVSEKTGMIFVKDEYNDSYLVPNSIREFVSFYAMLNDVLEHVEGADKNNIIKENIRQFYEYYEAVFLDTTNQSTKNSLDLVTENDNNIHFKTIYFLLKQKYDEIDSSCENEIKEILGKDNGNKNSFSDVIKVLSIIDERVNTQDVKKCANIIKVIYTAYLTVYREEIEKYEVKYRKFIGDSIWGELFNDVLPQNISTGTVSRFKIDPESMADIVSRVEFFDDEMKGEENYAFLSAPEIIIINDSTDKYEAIVDKIYCNPSKLNKHIIFWILIGLLVDTNNNKTVVANDKTLDNFFTVSIENYIYGLSNLNGLYERLNLSSAGCDRGEFQKVVEELENNNKYRIKCARYIVSSMDIMLDLLKYCKENKNLGEKKDVYENDNGSYTVTLEMFENIEKYMNEKLDFDFKSEKFYELQICDEIGTVNIPFLYHKIIGEICK